jgi:protein-S-isoprenylcysteine O-methyltransferase Ste14
MKNLYTRTFLSLLALAIVVGLLLFVSAGSILYWQGWLYLATFIGTSLLISIYLMRNDPALLERRMKGGPTAEKRTVQKFIMLLASLGFIGLLVIPALGFRFQWSTVPFAVEIMGDALVAIGFYLIYRVYRENTFSSATIEIAKDQRVISTGPYAVVRHPMYASALLYVIGTPLALGSYWGLLAAVFTFTSVLWRLLDEESFLAANLQGYTEYQKRVRYRLIPHVW